MIRPEKTTVILRRSPGRVRSSTAVAAIPRRDRIVISLCIVVITFLAWVYLIHLDRQMAPSMAYDAMMVQMGMATNTRWTAADLFFTFTMWVVMMAGMMTGSAAPVLFLFARARTMRGDEGVRLMTLVFGLGYFAVWTAFSAAATLAQWAMHAAALLSASMIVASPRTGGAVLLAAGIYQLLPIKGACLAHCKSPLGVLLMNWRDGWLGAFQMGARHGIYCLGCCWALMCVLFAVGIMNLIWVAGLTVFVLLEKIGRTPAILSSIAGVAMAFYGATLLVR